MDTVRSLSEHKLLQALVALGRVGVAQLEPTAGLAQIAAAIRPLLPHDTLDLIWLDGRGQGIRMRGLRGRFNAQAHWPVSQVLCDQMPLVVSDYMVVLGWIPSAEAPDLRSGLLLPLRSAGSTIGVLELGSCQPGAFDTTDLALAQHLADAIAPAVQSARLLYLERQQRERIEALNRIGRAIASSLNVDEVFDLFAAQTAQLIRHDAISVALLSDDGHRLDRFALATLYQFDVPLSERVELSETAARQVIEREQPLWSGDITVDRRFASPADRQWAAAGFRSYIAAPLRAKGRVIGVLTLVRRRAHAFDEADVITAEQVADQVAIFLDNMSLHIRARRLVVAEERNRIAREIHDTLAQSLTTISIQLEAAEHESYSQASVVEHIRAARTIARRALSEARRSVWDLQPSGLEDLPLREVLRVDLERWQQFSGITARLFVRGTSQLPLQTEIALLRIAQEALHNVYKYAHAREVRVELEYQGDEVCLLVSDDGEGFDPRCVAPENGAGGGFGLKAMADRARAVGGSFTVSSWPGNGTRIEARLPARAAGPQVLPAIAPVPMPVTTRVLIVEDQALVRQGLAALVSRIDGLLVVGTACDGYEAQRMARDLEPHVVLMDMRLPGIDGAATTRLLLNEHPALRVIILTSSDCNDDVARGIQAGARGYLLKEAPLEQLAETVRAVLRGEGVIASRLTPHLLDRLTQLAPEASETLSEREREVLQLMVAGRRNREIAQQLVISEHTVKSHISNIFAKLNVSDRAAAISAALQRNLA